MLVTRILSGLLWLLGASTGAAQDLVGSTGCTAPVCVFSNPNLRFGTGTETSVNAWGLFVQPWYFSRTANTWYKLTFSNYPLDTAIGTGYGSSHWSGTTIVNLYGITPTNAITDYTDFIVDSSDTSKSVGHGKIIATRTFVISGQPVILQNTFSLGWNDSFVKIVSRVINNDTNPVLNMLIWTGTRDDYVGMTDVNTKTRGNLDTGSFVAVTENSQSSRAIMITNTNEGVLFYSETVGVMTAYALCCSFSNVYNTYPLSLAPMTPNPTDGSYAAILPIGNVTTGGSGSITWFYAAGAVTSLSAVAQSVAAAQVADATPVPSADSVPSMAATYSASETASYSAIATDTATHSGVATATATRSAVPTYSGVPTYSPISSKSATPSPATTRSLVATPSPAPTLTSSSTHTATPSVAIVVYATPATIDAVPMSNAIAISVVSVSVMFVLASIVACCTCWYITTKRKDYCKECKHCTQKDGGVTIREHLRKFTPA
jgi:hypothetical protein